METDECILVIKQSVIKRDTRLASLARKRDRTTSRLVYADREHNCTVDAVREELSRLGITFFETPPHRLGASEKRKLSRSRLIVVVGGDGTLLNTSHYVRRGAVLGVNSAPKDSIGHFCFTDRRGFAKALDDCLGGRVLPVRLARLAVSIDAEEVQELALNDLLIAHESPAATTRYILKIGDRAEEQRSSGIWVSTAAGSTAAIRSAGGKRLPLGSRRMQYLVRELYRERGRDYALVRGVLDRGMEISIAAKMPEGRIYIDGSRTFYRFAFGARVRVRAADQDLRIFLRAKTKR